ncbi:MAG: response regulator transcription factor, partial [Actinobacteria bacterium]
MSKINVIVVDDDIYVRQALEVLLRRHPKTNPYSFFSTTEEAIDSLGEKKKAPDVMVLDIHFQGESENGISAIKKIRKVSPKLKILVSSMNKEQKSIVEAINSGADGVVWKNESGDGFISAIIKLVEGRFVVTKT